MPTMMEILTVSILHYVTSTRPSKSNQWIDMDQYIIAGINDTFQLLLNDGKYYIHFLWLHIHHISSLCSSAFIHFKVLGFCLEFCCDRIF